MTERDIIEGGLKYMYVCNIGHGSTGMLNVLWHLQESNSRSDH